MINRSMIIATALGIVFGSLLFLFVNKVIAQPSKEISETKISIYDRRNVLLYDGPINGAKNVYKRAPFAVDLTLSILKPLTSQKIFTTIDLDLQTKLQQELIENERSWKDTYGLKDIAVLLVTYNKIYKTRGVLAAIGSSDYFQTPQSHIDFLAFKPYLTIVAEPFCNSEKEFQLYVFANDQEGNPIQIPEIKEYLTQKISEFNNEGGGELYGQ